MPGITYEQADAQLALWIAASTDIATNGQSVTIGNRTYTAANLSEINKQIEFWDRQVKRLSSGAPGIRVRGGVPS